MTTANKVRDRVCRELDRLVPVSHCGDRPGLLVALSGGADSVALLLLARIWADIHDVPLAAAHFNHALRGAESACDEAFCRDLCAELEIDLAVGHPPAGTDAHSEEDLRRIRRSFLLTTLAADTRLAVCATGHHRNDQIETVLMRLFRGTGPDGLRGIRPRSGAFIHPLLSCGRDELTSWLTDRGQQWRDDATNTSGDNLRARMRREFLPVVHALFGQTADDQVMRFSDLVDDDARELDRQADELLASWRQDGLPLRCLPLAGLQAKPKTLGARLVRRICRKSTEETSPLRGNRLDDLLNWIRTARSGAMMELSEGWSVVLEFETLRFGHVSDPPPASSWRLECRDASATELENPLPEKGLNPSAAYWELTCPHGSLRGDLRIRPWREGDRLQPLGMTGHKKISDILLEHRVPITCRSGVPVVADDEGPFWLVGLCRDERTRLLPCTTLGITLHVDVHPGEEPSGEV